MGLAASRASLLLFLVQDPAHAYTREYRRIPVEVYEEGAHEAYIFDPITISLDLAAERFCLQRRCSSAELVASLNSWTDGNLRSKLDSSYGAEGIVDGGGGGGGSGDGGEAGEGDDTAWLALTDDTTAAQFRESRKEAQLLRKGLILPRAGCNL
eukprot:CAMPEP_0173288210 /NCGR_PEP_ID=MMETSP1143-20121109/10279_1 /TAXON_ID=483371 /ORGANISM="non described non described, Strain CCMP2298" /LENGTH=153 /DNA_ID=CAMNT_0014226927 /DNA_START=68 /DNA_END=526 /DNA_ORIENTATION=-